MSSISNIQKTSLPASSSYGPVRKERKKERKRSIKLTRENFSELCPKGTKVLLRGRVHTIQSGLRKDNTVVIQQHNSELKWLANIKLLKLHKPTKKASE